MSEQWYFIRKVRKRYGDGSKIFLYDDMLNREQVEDFNKQNQPIKGKYNAALAVKTKNGVFVGCKILRQKISARPQYRLNTKALF